MLAVRWLLGLGQLATWGPLESASLSFAPVGLAKIRLPARLSLRTVARAGYQEGALLSLASFFFFAGR